jgi:RNA polymerase sigma factor (sigma-70 family)
MVSVIRYLRRIAAGEAGAMTDGQLLEGFLLRRDDAAFEALVRRHGPMVLGVCQRVLHDLHAAEDAFQATFLVLVRKAGAIGNRELLGNWLYGVAYRTALRARATSVRRQAQERQVIDMPAVEPPEEMIRRELRPVIDAELNRLPEKFRAPVILCYLEGKTKEEAARQLGCPSGTVSSRLARARDLLRVRLARRGVTLAVGLTSAMLMQGAAPAAVPAPLLVSTVKAAALLAAGQVAAGALSAPVAALMEGVVQAMFLTKLKLAAVVLLSVGMLGGGAGVVAYQALSAEPSDAARAERPQPISQPAQPKTDAEKLQGTWLLVSAEREDGAKAPPAMIERFRAVFAKDQLTFQEGDLVQVWTFRVDVNTKPKALDLSPVKGTMKTIAGIYELEGDNLKLCGGPTSQGATRPTEFKGGPNHTLYVLKRAPAAKEGAKPKE